ncbi:MAG: type I restriction-modification enzyme R subunit C-terminal domain-containing protein [Bacteroidota bacterium]|nr:type I restriction-modification enzyme R subunit C-terminal domain-containing protein [Bacteroidota bacterium]
MHNQNPEQIARDNIDKQLVASDWIIQTKDKINLGAGVGVAVREYQTDIGLADYILFVNRKPVGVIEAKRKEEGIHLTTHESQTEEYAASKLKYLNNEPLVFLYESTGDVTRFTDYTDPKPRSREVFSFHRPESFSELIQRDSSLRKRLLSLPILPTDGLRECQIRAITKLDVSFKQNRPRALIQMATGSGKTFTAITAVYRLLKFAGAKRILFLVDTKNLGEQAEQEFLAYQPNDDNRRFTELYNVQRLRSSFVPGDAQVCISTIQRLYSILKETELDESAEEENPNERKFQPKEPVPVAYNEKVPIEFFDFIVIDECHRSIYNLWKQVLDYFDSFLIGLTATPDNRTFGFFNQNIVSEYTHEEAVTDGVNVGSDVFIIETDITKKGSVVWKGQYVDHRDKLTRKKRWQQTDEDVVYSATQLDESVVNINQIRLIVKTLKEHFPEIFPERFDADGKFEVPKTLIFAKSDSHADDIIQIVREEFAEENKFCKKITYTADNPKSTLAQFRNDYYPRIAVTVDMIATGTDVKPLECLFFMRDVKSRNYFEQMKGRGTRTITLDELKKVTPSAKYTKDHFVIVDAIGVTKSLKTDSRPLEKKPSVPLKDLLGAVAVGARDEDLFTSLANRLIRLERQINEQERAKVVEKTKGKSLAQIAKELLYAYNPDVIEELGEQIKNKMPDESPAAIESAVQKSHSAIIEEAAKVFTGELNTYIENVRKTHEQLIDTINRDTLVGVGWDGQNKAKADELIKEFTAWIEANKNEIIALQIFYNQPYRRRELTFTMIKELLDKLKSDKPALAPLRLWDAYEQQETALVGITQRSSPKTELVALVSLLRKVTGIDKVLSPYDKTVDKNFQEWVFKKQAGALKFTDEQMQWLRMIKDHIAISFHIEKDDFALSPFGDNGGLGKMWELFGEKTDEIIIELNEVLVA